jgi:putative ABC transport system permease protein
MPWYSRLVNLVRSDRLSRDIDREMAFHVAERADDLVARGMSEDTAAWEARRRFGNRTLQQERTRDADLIPWLESVVADVRYAARALWANPTFSIVACLSLALGIGANTAIFSLVNALLLKSLPVERPEEVVQVVTPSGKSTFSNLVWEQIRDTPNLFAGVAASGSARFDLASGGEVRQAGGNWVSGSFFAVLGVRAILGRVVGPADDVRGCPTVVMLSHSFWQRQFGGDAGIIGTRILLSGKPFEVVGVLDPRFHGIDVGTRVDLFAPLCLAGAGMLDNAGTSFLRIVGRRDPRWPLTQTRARLAAVAPRIFAATVFGKWTPTPRQSQDYLQQTLDAVSMPTGISPYRARYEKPLLILMAVVGLVLLIACANVANLLAARASARQRELAIRMAIGAGRARLVRQLLTESLLLASVGALLGLAFAQWGSRLLVAMLADSFSVIVLNLSPDGRVLGFTIMVALAAGALFGLAPAWQATRIEPQTTMKSGGRGSTSSRSRVSFANTLVVTQLALSLVLVVGAALFVGTFTRLIGTDAGFEPARALIVSVNMENARPSPEQRRAGKRELFERLRRLPGVRSVATVNVTPFSGSSVTYPSLSVDGLPPLGRDDATVYVNNVSAGYFTTVGTQIVAGRDFDANDRLGATRVGLISESAAKKFFRGMNPIGKHIRMPAENPTTPPIEIVGVAGDSKLLSLREAPLSMVYLADTQDEYASAAPNFLLRTSGPPLAMRPAATAAIAEVDRGIRVEYATLSDLVAGSLSRERLLATLVGFFGGLSLLLSMIGLYGLMSYMVTRRTNEIGVRIALGAPRRRVLAMILGEAGRLTAGGIIIGVIVAIASMRFVASLLFGVTPADPSAIGISVLALAGVAVAAAAVPAWRAARLDPMVALRNE